MVRAQCMVVIVMVMMKIFKNESQVLHFCTWKWRGVEVDVRWWCTRRKNSDVTTPGLMVNRSQALFHQRTHTWVNTVNKSVAMT